MTEQQLDCLENPDSYEQSYLVYLLYNIIRENPATDFSQQALDLLRTITEKAEDHARHLRNITKNMEDFDYEASKEKALSILAELTQLSQDLGLYE